MCYVTRVFLALIRKIGVFYGAKLKTSGSNTLTGTIGKTQENFNRLYYIYIGRMSLATKNWAKELSKGILNEFKKCLEEYVERLEKEAKEVVEMLEKTTDDKAKADPANKKMMKEELKDKKERVKIFKENTKKQMKDILNTLKLNPGNNQFKYKSAFQSEFDNFQKNMELFASGKRELSEEPPVKNVLIELNEVNEAPMTVAPIDPALKEFYSIYGEDPEPELYGYESDDYLSDREQERIKRQRIVDAVKEFSYGGTQHKKKRQSKKRTRKSY